MQNHQEAHQVPPRTHEVHQVAPRTYEVNEVRPGSYVVKHVPQVNEEFYQVRRHRHKEWTSFSVPLCPYCLQNHARTLQVRYAVAAVIGPELCELCQCPCRK